MSWFLHRIISNPSAFILGQPGLGKTSLVHRWITVLADWGVIPMVLADSRPTMYQRSVHWWTGDYLAPGHILIRWTLALVRQLNDLVDVAERNKRLRKCPSRKALVSGGRDVLGAVCNRMSIR